ncbi:MAG: glycosyltransferase family 4 protein [Actinomycetota bacterium]
MRIHFVTAATKNGIGGGTTAWKNLLSKLFQQVEITLHYPSDADGIWSEFLNPEIKHESHHDWLTYENRGYQNYDQNYKSFRFNAIPANSLVVLDSMEAVRQLVPGLAERNCQIYWHLQSPYRLPRRNLIFRFRDQNRLKKLKKIIAVSNFLKKVSTLDAKIVKTVYLGIPQADDAQRIDGKFPQKIGYFGRYEGYKNPLFLEKLAFESLYIGSIKGCTSPVNIPPEKDLGWLPVSEAVRLADFFIFPCIEEAFGLSIIELQAYGKICICFDSGAFPEIIESGKNGFLVNPLDSDRVNAIISELQANPSLKQKIQNAAVESVKKYSLDSYAKNFIAAITDP